VRALVAVQVVPVEYGVAVDRYLAQARLSPASRRVYRISLTGWAWPLVDRLPPPDRTRRLAPPPVVPLAVLDSAVAPARLAAAIAHRARRAQPRTVDREISVLRSAVAWWRHQQWIVTDPTAGLRPAAGSRWPGEPADGHAGADYAVAGRPMAPRVAARPALTSAQRAALFASPASLRDQALWHVLQDCAAPAQVVLGLDADGVHVASGHARSAAGRLYLSQGTADLLGWLLAGRRSGPVFLTDRKAPAGTPPADRCPLTGRARLSYRRAAELFAEHTRPLDPDGRGWVLHQLRRPTALSRPPRR
jgi:hypothetical protein